MTARQHVPTGVGHLFVLRFSRGLKIHAGAKAFEEKTTLANTQSQPEIARPVDRSIRLFFWLIGNGVRLLIDELLITND